MIRESAPGMEYEDTNAFLEVSSPILLYRLLLPSSFELCGIPFKYSAKRTFALYPQLETMERQEWILRALFVPTGTTTRIAWLCTSRHREPHAPVDVLVMLDNVSSVPTCRRSFVVSQLAM